MTTGLRKVRSYDLDGKLLWELSGMTVNVTPTPFASHGLVFINSGYPGALAAAGLRHPAGRVRRHLAQAGTDEQRVHRLVSAAARHLQHVVAGLRRLYYTLLDRGFLLSHDAKTGKQVYGRQRISPEAGGFTSSPWAYNGKIFLLSEDGDTFVVAGRTRVQAARQELAQRDVAGDAGRRARQRLHPHAVEAVPDREATEMMFFLRVLCVLCGFALLTLPRGTVFAQTAALKQVGTFRVPADTVELRGSHAFVAGGRTLTILDLSDPASPKKVADYSFPEQIWSFRLAGPYAYVAANFYGLGVLDVSNPAAPKLRASIKTPGQAKGVALVGTTAFVADHMSGVDVVDLSSLDKPTLRGSFFVDGYARDVATSSRFAFAIDAPTGLYALDPARPGEPRRSGRSSRPPPRR